MNASESSSIICPVVVGRASELAVIERLIAQIGANQPASRVLLIEGDAGVGKSRLVSSLVERVERDSWNVLQGNCFEPDQSLPYAPITDLLDRFCAKHSYESLERYFDADTAELRTLLPDLAAFLPPNGALTLEPLQAQRRLFHALAQFCARLATNNPLLMVIEDVHWSDAVTLDWLLYLARRISTLPVLLVLTFRHHESSTALLRFLAELDRRRLAAELSLARLSRDDVGAMLRAILKLDRPARPALLDALYALTEGNPFFVEETLKALMANGHVSASDVLWTQMVEGKTYIPRSVHDAIQRRTEYLSEAARNTLTLAAVIGRRFDWSLLQHIAAVDEAKLVQQLKELIGAQLVVEMDVDQFAFRHVLAREAVYKTLLERERRMLHRRVAEALEDVQPEQHLADLAYHFFEAGLWEQALTYAKRAAAGAERLYAPHEVAAQITRALHAAQHIFAAPIAPLYHMRGRAYEVLGDFQAARNDYEAALNTARAVGSRRDEWQALLDLGFLWSSRDYVRSGEYLQAMLQLARSMNDIALLASSLNRMGNWQLNLDQPFAAQQYHREALDLFEQLDDQAGLAATLDLLGIASYLSGDLAKGTGYFSQAVASFRTSDDRQGLVHSLTHPILRAEFDSEALDRETLINASSEQPLQLARGIGWRAGEAFVFLNLGSHLCSVGEYGHALEVLDKSMAICEEIEHQAFIAQTRAALGRVYLALLDPQQAVRFLEPALAIAETSGSLLLLRVVGSVLSMVHVQRGVFEQAETMLRACRPLTDDVMQPMSVMLRQVRIVEAELALARGNAAEALRDVDQLIAGTVNLGHSVVPRLWLLRGAALCALERYNEAEAVLLAAAEAAKTQGRRPLVWPITIALGNVYRVQKRRDEAERMDTAARVAINECAATIADPHVRAQFLERAMAPIPESAPATPRQAAKKAFDGLTDREREVAILVMQGHSNRQIAQMLVLSERTVTTHIGNILSKLHLSSRTQIARWALDKGLAPS